jgi:UDP-N-acetylglucosamine--N-acetylmuramyl-(pentapeptide) pyrophosphoryl-undecaprenol N-acetylglucosamine transferase
VAFPEAVEFLPRSARARAVVAGNPVRPPVSMDPATARRRLGLEEAGVVVLVTGGSQGSAALNTLVLEALREVAARRLTRPEGMQLLWSTGPSHIDGIRTALGDLGSPAWVRAVGYVDDMPSALAASDLAVSRAGAMATSEFTAWGIPAVLVPLPSAAADHQTRNARALAEAGAVVHLVQAGLKPVALWAAMAGLVTDDNRRDAMARAARGRGHPDAALQIARALVQLLPAAPPVELSR